MLTKILTGISGKSYLFTLCDANGVWLEKAGLYAFCDSFGHPKYIGETGNFASRQPGPKHEKWLAAMASGATIIYAHVMTGSKLARAMAEADLIQLYNPACNVQMRTGSTILTSPKRGLHGIGITPKV